MLTVRCIQHPQNYHGPEIGNVEGSREWLLNVRKSNRKMPTMNPLLVQSVYALCIAPRSAGERGRLRRVFAARGQEYRQEAGPNRTCRSSGEDGQQAFAPSRRKVPGTTSHSPC